MLNFDEHSFSTPFFLVVLSCRSCKVEMYDFQNSSSWKCSEISSKREPLSAFVPLWHRCPCYYGRYCYESGHHVV